MGTTMGLTELWTDGIELGDALAAPADPGELTRIAGQIARLEDKLEDVLVAVERLEDQLAQARAASGSGSRCGARAAQDADEPAARSAGSRPRRS